MTSPNDTAPKLDINARIRAEAGYGLVLSDEHPEAKLAGDRLTEADRFNAMAAAAVWIAILGNVDCGMGEL